MSDTLIPDALHEYSRRMLVDEYWPRLRDCVESLTDDQVYWRPQRVDKQYREPPSASEWNLGFYRELDEAT